MMNVKEMRLIWNNGASEKESCELLGEAIINDISALIQSRNPQTDKACQAILKETLNKFNKLREVELQVPAWIYPLSIKTAWPKIYEFAVRDNIIKAI